MEAKDGTAKVNTPRTDGFVSLQATAADAAGSKVRQTILRAYGSGRPGSVPPPGAEGPTASGTLGGRLRLTARAPRPDWSAGEGVIGEAGNLGSDPE